MSSTTDNEQRFAYLLSPEFQIVNTAGKPLTGGWIEVYIHGTRVKYYCFSDFDGTLHPFQIPLDSLGSNIVLASPTHAYDIYIYNKFGALVMSRYNVVPACNAADIVEDVVVIDSPDETINVTCDGGSNWHLEVNTDLIATTEQLASVSGDLQDQIDNKKDLQLHYVASGSVTKTITKIEQNENGEIEVTYSDIDLPPQVPNIDIISPSGTIDVNAVVNPSTNTKTFKIDIHKTKMDFFDGYCGKSHYEDRSSTSTSAFGLYVDQWDEYKYQGDFIANNWQDENNTTFKLNSGLYLITASIRYQMNNDYNKEEYIRIATGAYNGLENGTRYKDWSYEKELGDGTAESSIQVSFIRNVEDDDDYTYMNGNHDLYFYPYLPVGVNYAFIDHLQIVKLDSIAAAGGGSGPRYAAGYGIEILDDVIQVATGTVVTNNYFNTVVSSINNEINEISTTIQNVTGDITELNEAVTNIVGATGDFATTEYVDNRIASAAGDVYEAGQYVSIENNVINVTGVQPEGDYATNEDLQIVSGAIPESQEVEFEELDLAQFAQASAVTVIQNQINNVTGDINNINEAVTNIIGATGDYATEEYVDEAIAAVTGQPFEQVNSDWNAVSGKAEILNKPDVFQLIAGNNIDITASGNDLVISSTGGGSLTQINSDWLATSGVAEILNKPLEANIVAGQNISIVQEYDNVIISATGIPSLDGYATEQYVDEAIVAATGMIPEAQVNADWLATSGKAEILNKPQEEAVEFEEVNLEDYALASAIPDVSNFVTQQDIDNSIAPVQSQIDTLAAATGDYATEQYVNDAIDTVIGMIPSDVVTHAELNDAIDTVTGMIHDVSNFVTQQDIDNSIAPVQSQIDTLAAATGDYLTEQVNADWNATSGVSEILNKPESEEVQFEEVDLSVYALASAIPSLDGYATEQYVDNAIATVTGIIPSDVVTEQELADAIDAATGLIPQDTITHVELANAIDSATALIPDVSYLEADIQTVSGAIDAVSGAIPESEEVEFEEVDLSVYALASAVPDTTQLETDVANLVAATGDYLTQQVNADWEANSGAAEILNKPVEYELVAGDNINIIASGGNVIISAQGGGTGEVTEVELATVSGVLESEIQTVSGAIDAVSGSIPESESVEFEELDLSDYALASAIPDVSNFVTQQDVNNTVAPIQTEINDLVAVTGDYLQDSDLNGYATEAYVDAAITGATFEQVNSDWNATSGVAEILNKPSVVDVTVGNLIAGDNISITASGDDIVISSNGGGGSSAQVNSDWNATSGVAEILNKPESETVEFEEVDLSDYALASAIPDISDMATETWVEQQGYLTSVPSTYVTDTELNSAVSGLATKTEVNSKQNTLTGITDVQVVNSLPVSPVSTVLYLIPEA